MQTLQEVRKKLRIAEVNLRATRERFEEYDNHDDMDLIPVYEQEVETLKWVLNERKQK